MTSELDLMIRAALLANLPRAGSVWSEEERQEWLRLAEIVFRLVYEDEQEFGSREDGREVG
jgi:hypothetical protein